MKVNMNKGISLMEILVVITIFAVLGILVTQSVLLTVRGSKKSETLVRVRENLNYAMGVIERQIRNADSIDCAGSSPTELKYTDQEGNNSSFWCLGIGGEDPYVASGAGVPSSRLTASTVKVTECSFVCTPEDSVNLGHVDIAIEAKSAGSTGTESSMVTVTNKIYLRNY